MKSIKKESNVLKKRKFNQSAHKVKSILDTEHYRFLLAVTKNKTQKNDNKFRINRYKRILDVLPTDSNGFNDLMYADDKYITPTLKLHPEFASFLFWIDGCAKNLLMYIIMFELDHVSGNYAFNIQIRDHFSNYAQKLFGVNYKNSTIEQAHRKLEQYNITCNVRRGIYFLNPLVAGGKTETIRRKLLNDYTKLLLSKNQKDEFLDIFPVYKN